jgi:hypothetical protein
MAATPACPQSLLSVHVSTYFVWWTPSLAFLQTGSRCLHWPVTLQRSVPSLFQFRCDQPVERIGGVVLRLGALRTIACRLQLLLKRIYNLLSLTGLLLMRQHRCLYRPRLQDPHDLGRHRIIDGSAAESNAAASLLSNAARVQA